MKGYYVEGVHICTDSNACCAIAHSLGKAVDGNELQQIASATAMYGYYAKNYFTA